MQGHLLILQCSESLHLYIEAEDFKNFKQAVAQNIGRLEFFVFSFLHYLLPRENLLLSHNAIFHCF